MKRRTILSLLTLAIITIITAMSVGASTASAQIPIRWCGLNHYTVDLTALGGWTCFPLTIGTSWGGGLTVWPPAGFPGYPGPGIYVENPTPVLPVGTPLDWVNVCGLVLPGVTGQYTVNCPPCLPICVTLCLDPAGCLYIKVYPEPCPGVMLPCP